MNSFDFDAVYDSSLSFFFEKEKASDFFVNWPLGPQTSVYGPHETVFFSISDHFLTYYRYGQVVVDRKVFSQTKYDEFLDHQFWSTVVKTYFPRGVARAHCEPATLLFAIAGAYAAGLLTRELVRPLS